MKLLLVLLLEHIGTTLHGKDNLDVNLRIGVRHRFAIMGGIALGWASGNRLGTGERSHPGLLTVQPLSSVDRSPLRGLVSSGRGGYYKQATPYGVWRGL